MACGEMHLTFSSVTSIKYQVLGLVVGTYCNGVGRDNTLNISVKITVTYSSIRGQFFC